MPPNPLESMLLTMMTSLFNPDQKSIIVCSRCSKAKITQGQQSSSTTCNCGSHRSKKKHKRRSRKLKKSCLKTIVCVSKMVMNGGDCLDCACHECGENRTIEAKDERFCSKCGQLLSGENPVDIPSIELEECRKQLELCKQEHNETKNMNLSATRGVVDSGVQVNIGREEPLTLRIRVCACPNGTKSHGNLCQSRSEPDMSKANITYDDYDTSDIQQAPQPQPPDSAGLKEASDWRTDIAIMKGLALKMAKARLVEDAACNYNASPQPQPLNSVGLEETSDWRTDIAIMKELALKMTKARLVEDAACWKRASPSRMLQQHQDMPRGSEEAEGELSEAVVNSRKTVELDDGPRISRHAHLSCEDEPAAQQPGGKTRMSTANTFIRTSNVYNAPPNPDIWNESLRTVYYGPYHIPTQNMSVGCCSGTGVYCYSPQNPSPYGGHCENTCSCSNSAPFVPYKQSVPSYVYSPLQQPLDQNFVDCNGNEPPHSSSTRRSAWSPPRH